MPTKVQNEVIEVLHFNRASGNKKCRDPVKSEALQDVLDRLAIGPDGELPKNFCKKDPTSGFQKQLGCLVCNCRMESFHALKCHLNGDKHASRLRTYMTQKGTVSAELKSVKENILIEGTPVVGLNYVQEHVMPGSSETPRFYKEEGSPNSVPGDSSLSDKDKDPKNPATNRLTKRKRKTKKAIPKGFFDLVELTPMEWLPGDLDTQNYPDTGPPSASKKGCSGDDVVDLLTGTPGAGSSVTSESGKSALMTNPNSSSNVLSLASSNKRKVDESEPKTDVKKAKLETKALKAKRPGFTDERYNETSYYYDPESNLRKVYPYYFTFTTFTKGRWVGEKILDVFTREFRAHPAEEYERCIKAGTLTVNYDKVEVDYRLKHNDLLANIVHRHEVPVSSGRIKIIHIDEDLVVVNKPASIPVHPCGRYRHNTVVFILAKDYGLKNLRTIHRLDRLTSGLLLFGRNPKKAREMEQHIRTRQVRKAYVCRVEGEFPLEPISCKEPIEVVSYKIGVCKVSTTGKDCHTDFELLSCNGSTSVVLCRPHTGRMHQIRVHLQYLGYPVVNDPLYNHKVFGPEKGKGGRIGKTDEQLIQELIAIHNAENWLGMDENGSSTSGDGGLGPVGGLPVSSMRGSAAGIKENKNPSCGGAESPDSDVDVRSLSASAGSPSSTSSSGSVAPKESKSSDDGDRVTTTATQTGVEDVQQQPYDSSKLSIDPHCYECKVKYRDPRPKDLVMFLHAHTYAGPDWAFETEVPAWAKKDWVDPEDYLADE